MVIWSSTRSLKMFVRWNVSTHPRVIDFVIHKHTKYFNTTLYGKQPHVCAKTFLEWKYDSKTQKNIQHAAHLMDMSHAHLFAFHFRNHKNDGMYIHPLLVQSYLKYVSPNHANQVIAAFYRAASRSSK